MFIVWHGYWALGGDFGFGDQEAGIPGRSRRLDVHGRGRRHVRGRARGAAGLARGVGPRRLLVGLMWAGAAVLAAARASPGSSTTGSASAGSSETGLSGLSDEQVLGSADPSAYTIWSTVGIDAFFALGGLLFGAAPGARGRATRAARLRMPRWSLVAGPAYAASAWAVAYAVGVRGYQGLGGTLGLPGTLRGPGRHAPGQPARRRRPPARRRRRARARRGRGASAFRAGSSSSRRWPARRSRWRTR